MKKLKKRIKMFFIILFSIIGVLLIMGTLFLNFSPQFGSKMGSKSLKKAKQSPHYKDGKFHNIEKTEVMVEFKMGTMMKFLTNGNQTVPKDPLPVIKLPKDHFKTASKEETRVTWFGHSSILVEMEGKTFFLDPIFSKVPAPHPLFGTNRFNKEFPIDIDQVSPLDAIIISHDHYDHLDYNTIKKLKDRVKKFYVPIGLKSHLTYWGVESSKIIELDWWEEIDFDHIKLVLTPTRHFSGRALLDRFKTLWGSWVIKGKNSSLFFSGDSGYSKVFKEIGDKYGPFDITMVECGQYNEGWRNIHMFPEESVQAHIDLKGKLMLPIHWGSFKLSIHSWFEPVERAYKEAKIKGVNIATPKIGETITVGKDYPSSKWWEELNN